MVFVLVQIFHFLKIAVSQLLEIIDRCHLFIFFLLFILCICVYIYFIFINKKFYTCITISNLLAFFFLKFYYCVSDIVIYLIYIDLMRKRSQLINICIVLN